MRETNKIEKLEQRVRLLSELLMNEVQCMKDQMACKEVVEMLSYSFGVKYIKAQRLAIIEIETILRPVLQDQTLTDIRKKASTHVPK